MARFAGRGVFHDLSARTQSRPRGRFRHTQRPRGPNENNMKYTLMAAACLTIALLPRVASAQDVQWKEGIHYQLSKTAANDAWVSSNITVTAFVSYANPESAKFAVNFPKWKASLPKFVHANLRPFVHDERTVALANLFLALEVLKRPDLHLRAFLEQTTPGKSLVVMKSADKVDFEQSAELQAVFLQPHGVSREDFRRALNDPTVAAGVRRSVDIIVKQGSPSATPSVYVNQKYITDLHRVGATQVTDAVLLTDKLFDVTNHLIALSDIDNMRGASADGGVLTNLANDPVLGAWHTVVPGMFEVERKSGIWYFHRDGVFGGRALLTDLDTGKVLTGTGAARVASARIFTAMKSTSTWAEPAAIALRAGANADEVTRQDMQNVWEVRRSSNQRDVSYYLSPDGRYHFVTVAQSKEIADWQAKLDSLAAGPGSTNPQPLKEGSKGTPSSPEDKSSRAKELAKIADADTILFAPAGTARATLTIFLDPRCAHCRRLVHDTDKLTARGVRLRIVPVHHTTLATNIWCARDRRAALRHAMKEISLWPACAGEARDGFAPLYRNLFINHTPAAFNSRGEVVVGYTTPEELIRVLVN